MIQAFYFFLLFILTIYSYALVDLNLTFVSNRWWEFFRESMIELGYYQRDLSWLIYLLIIILLFAAYFYFKKRYERFDAIKLAMIISALTFISYPFLSHDFFNYMFDAKLITYYHVNPYFYKALDFPSDPWIRFMHWTHRTYPYGPIFLLITLLPSFFSLGKFILSFLFFKLTFIAFYLLAVYYLNKLNKRYAILFALNPLVIIEGLVNSHNDLIGVSLAIIGVYILFHFPSHPERLAKDLVPTKSGRKSRFARFFVRRYVGLRMTRSEIVARLFFLLSIGIKFITFPVLFLTRRQLKLNKIIFGLLFGAIIYLSFKSEIQPWYFLNLLIFLPFFEEIINRMNIFFFGLLLSYYPYIRLGGWDSSDKIILKHWIIAAGALLNIFYLIFLQIKKREKKTVA